MEEEAPSISPYPSNVVACEPGASSIDSIQFSDDNGSLLFHVLLFKDSLWAWIGNPADATISNISVALSDAPAKVHGNNETGARIATHLHKRFKQVAFVSYNIAADDEETARVAERTLIAKLAEKIK